MIELEKEGLDMNKNTPLFYGSNAKYKEFRNIGKVKEK